MEKKSSKNKNSKDNAARQVDLLIIKRIKYSLYGLTESNEQLEIDYETLNKESTYSSIASEINDNFQVNVNGTYVSSRWKTLKDTLRRYYTAQEKQGYRKPTAMQEFVLEHLYFLKVVLANENPKTTEGSESVGHSVGIGSISSPVSSTIPFQGLPTIPFEATTAHCSTEYEIDETIQIIHVDDNGIQHATSLNNDNPNGQTKIANNNSITMLLDNTSNSRPLEKSKGLTPLGIIPSSQNASKNKTSSSKKSTPLSILFSTKVPDSSSKLSKKEEYESLNENGIDNGSGISVLQPCPQALCVYKEFKLLAPDKQLACFLDLSDASTEFYNLHSDKDN